jgi:methenyltetrahydrofolate cyclohydrolase
MTYINEPLQKYLDDLAARMPAPGGGSAAALSGAIGSALLGMVLNFTIDNDEYRDFEPQAKVMRDTVEGLRKKFTKLFDEDVNGYDLVSRAYKLPKDTDVDKIKRNRAVKEALRQATLTPLHVCQYSVEGLKLCPVLAKSANKKLICDVEVPVRLFEAAFYSAKVNVVMNIKSIEDEEFNKDIAKQLIALEKELAKYKESAEKEISAITGKTSAQ